MVCPEIKRYILSDHVLWQMKRRGIEKTTVDEILKKPEQCEEISTGRYVYQSRIGSAEKKARCLVRVFVDIDREPADVVTAYKTGKIKKYWR